MWEPIRSPLGFHMMAMRVCKPISGGVAQWCLFVDCGYPDQGDCRINSRKIAVPSAIPAVARPCLTALALWIAYPSFLILMDRT